MPPLPAASSTLALHEMYTGTTEEELPTVQVPCCRWCPSQVAQLCVGREASNYYSAVSEDAGLEGLATNIRTQSALKMRPPTPGVCGRLCAFRRDTDACQNPSKQDPHLGNSGQSLQNIGTAGLGYPRVAKYFVLGLVVAIRLASHNGTELMIV